MQLQEGSGSVPVCSLVPTADGWGHAMQVQKLFCFCIYKIFCSATKTANFTEAMALVDGESCDCLPDCERTDYQYAMTSSSRRLKHHHTLLDHINQTKTMNGTTFSRSCDSRNLNFYPLCSLETGPLPKLWLEQVSLCKSYPFSR